MTIASRMSADEATVPADLDGAIASYQRLAAMDPPALRSLVAELNQISLESAASAEEQATPEALARADRSARRAAAARAALDSIDAEDEYEAVAN